MEEKYIHILNNIHNRLMAIETKLDHLIIGIKVLDMPNRKFKLFVEKKK